MLSNPLTPPPDNAFSPAAQLTPEMLAQSNPLFQTPTSNADTSLDALDSRSDSLEEEDLSEAEMADHEMSDEDMEDGGAALSPELTSVEELEHEMDILDAEAVGAENLLGLFHSAEVPPTIVEEAFLQSEAFLLAQVSDYSQSNVDEDDEMSTGIGQESEVQTTSTLPSTIIEVAQQLQHLQNAQEHADFEVAPAEQHTIINNSITPFHFFISHPGLTNSQSFPEGNFVSMADILAVNSVPLPAPSQNAPHLWSTEGWTPASAYDIVMGDVQGDPQSDGNAAWEQGSDADQNEVEDNSNLSLGHFLYDWGTREASTSESRRRDRGPSIAELHAQRYPDELLPVKRKDLQGERCDVQRIDWEKLGVRRSEARSRRRHTYKNYTNLRIERQWHPRLHGAQLKDDQNFFRFRRMDFDHNVHLSHFQLRNLLSCASRDHIFYAGRSRIIQWNPTSGTPGPKRVAMNLSNPMLPSLNSIGGVQISTLSVGHDILVAGGFGGEYALVNLKAHKSTKHTEGIVTNHQNSITNHVQVHLSRTSLSPRVAIASNDNGMRVLDVATNNFIADHVYDHAINCTAVSPDQRLRVLVGDSRQFMICNAETGEILQSLEGHRDFGFACDWADDGYTVATGNQDMQIKIWDARRWTNNNGVACPVTTIAAEMAGVRKLKFSPLGSGKRVLVAAEPADMINVIDAETFTSKQVLSFFGEIGGFDFTNGGRDLIVANCDSMRGGLMEYERCDLTSGSPFDMDDLFESGTRRRLRGAGYDSRPTDEEFSIDRDSQGKLRSRRRSSLLGAQMGHF